MGQQLGPHTKRRLISCSPKTKSADHTLELPTGDRLPLSEFLDQLGSQPQAAQTTGDSQQFYLAIGSSLKAPTPPKSRSLSKTVPSGMTSKFSKAKTLGKRFLKSAFQHPQAHTSPSIPTAAAQPETAAAEQSRKDITVFVKANATDPTQPPNFAGRPRR